MKQRKLSFITIILKQEHYSHKATNDVTPRVATMQKTNVSLRDETNQGLSRHFMVAYMKAVTYTALLQTPQSITFIDEVVLNKN